MTQSCGLPLEFIQGGTLRDAAIIGSQITDSRISNSILDGCQITNLKSIDAASAQVIAQALFENATVVAASDPLMTADIPMTTVVMGGRDILLGKPVMFAKLGQFVIPLYREGM